MKPIKQQVDSFMESIMAGDDKVIAFMVDGTKTLTEDFTHILKDALEQIVVKSNLFLVDWKFMYSALFHLNLLKCGN